MAASDYLEEMIQKSLYNSGTWTNPTAWFVSLHTESPTDVGDVGELTIGSNGYTRQALGPTTATTPEFIVSNTAALTFTASGGDWAQVTYFGVYDASTGGNLLDYGALDNARTILDGGSLVVPAGDLDIKQI